MTNATEPFLWSCCLNHPNSGNFDRFTSLNSRKPSIIGFHSNRLSHHNWSYRFIVYSYVIWSQSRAKNRHQNKYPVWIGMDTLCPVHRIALKANLLEPKKIVTLKIVSLLSDEKGRLGWRTFLAESLGYFRRNI